MKRYKTTEITNATTTVSIKEYMNLPIDANTEDAFSILFFPGNSILEHIWRQIKLLIHLK